MKEDNKKVYLFGAHSCYAALLSRKRELFELYVNDEMNETCKKKILDKTVNEAKRRGVAVNFTSKNHLDDLVHFDRPEDSDIVLKAGVLKCTPLESCGSPKSGDNIWLALDQIQDPINIGSIIRSCAHFGVCRVVISGECSDQLSAVASYVSKGTLEGYPCYSVPSIHDFLKNAKLEGWNTIATTGPLKDKYYRDVDDISCLVLNSPTILVLGSEGSGLSKDVIDVCSHLASITSLQNKMPPGFDSLNVSAATGIMLHVLLNNSKFDWDI